jgi:hypothetical protein
VKRTVRHDWEQTRYSAFVQLKSQGAKFDEPRDLFLLDGETSKLDDIKKIHQRQQDLKRKKDGG